MSSNSSALQINNAPDHTLLLLDLQAITINSSFPGIVLPPGLHLILLTPPSTPLRKGFFINVEEDAPRIFSYTYIDNTFVSLPAKPFKAEPHPYAQPDSALTFSDLTADITPEFLTATLGDGWTLSTTSEPELPLLLPSRTWDAEDTGAKRTDRARDATWYLLESGRFEVRTLRAVGQLGFVGAALAVNPACAVAWESLVRCLVKVRSGNRRAEVAELWEVVLGQLRVAEGIEGGLEEGGLSGLEEPEGWFVRGLRGLWRYLVEEGEGCEEVTRAVEKVKDWGEAKGWIVDARMVVGKGTMELEDGEEVQLDWKAEGWGEEEYAPVIVDLDGSGNSAAAGEAMDQDEEDYNPSSMDLGEGEGVSALNTGEAPGIKMELDAKPETRQTVQLDIRERTRDSTLTKNATTYAPPTAVPVPASVTAHEDSPMKEAEVGLKRRQKGRVVAAEEGDAEEGPPNTDVRTSGGKTRAKGKKKMWSVEGAGE